MTTRKTALLLSALMTLGSLSMQAQNYYDDDIYYNPSKDVKKAAGAQAAKAASKTVVTDYPAADTYTVVSSNTMSVDEYNRRGIFADKNTTSADTAVSDFNYTRRIERFYNPDVVTSTGDSQLADIYYAEPANVNIIINDPYWGWSSPSWSWGWGWNSWNAWRPAWGPAWAWGPSWSWGWSSPSWAWGWGYPSWGWSWGPGWGGPAWGGPAWVGPSRPNRHPGHVWNGGRVPATGHNTANVRPGTIYRPGSVANTGSVTGGRRPATSTARPSNNSNNYRPSTGTLNGGRRPATNNNNGNSFTRPSNNSNSGNNSYNSNSHNNSNNSYQRPGRGGSGYSSSGSFGGGSNRSSGSFGGGGSSRGGGGRSGGRH